MLDERLNLLNDQELISHYRSTQDVRAVGALFQRYKHLVYGVCVKYFKNTNDAEDAVMEIFEKLHLDLKKSEPNQFKSWLYMVARNHCLMQLRKAGLAVEYPETLPQQETATDDLDDKMIQEVLFEKLEKGLFGLRSEQKTCLELFYLKEMSYKQIVVQTGFGLAEVKTHLQNGKLNLKKLLSKDRF
jgi:RNA polymerase sigma-70 factor (ECF subfamily)